MAAKDQSGVVRWDAVEAMKKEGNHGPAARLRLGLGKTLFAHQANEARQYHLAHPVQPSAFLPE